MSTAHAQQLDELETPADGLPEGWASTTLSEVCEINPPKPPANVLSSDAPVTFVPMPAVDADMGAITNPQTRPFAQVRKGFTAFRDGDVIMAKITPCMENGKAARAIGLLNGLGFGSTEFHVLRPTGAIHHDFVYHFIRQESYRKDAEAEMAGSVGQKRVPVNFIEQTGFVLPPFDEQLRIVAKIEQLLVHAHASREHLAKVPKILKAFRQSVLAAACSGRLTEDWRKSHQTVEPASGFVDSGAECDLLPTDFLLPDRWTLSTIGKLVNAIEAGKNIRCEERPPRSGEKGIVKISAVTWGEFDEHESKTLPNPSAFMPNRKIEQGDLLISRANTIELVGAPVLVRSIASDLMLSDKVLRLVVPIDWRAWVFNCLRSPMGRNQVESLATGNQLSMRNISQQNLRRIVIPLPPLEEQHEIVRRVEALFKLADAIERRVAAATKRAEKLTQAVLGKAFRGELVPTEAELARREGRDYEPASALLTRIKKERNSEPKRLKHHSPLRKRQNPKHPSRL